jgi:hypothetical protein
MIKTEDHSSGMLGIASKHNVYFHPREQMKDMRLMEKIDNRDNGNITFEWSKTIRHAIIKHKYKVR